MKHITSPYNFAPIASKVYAPDWADRVSHDIPFSDGEDGVIDVTLENVSPLFTRNGSSTKDETFSSHINTPEGKLYFIPGSTLKGMLRNLVSIMSFGKMQEGCVYKNRSFGWRDVNVRNKSRYQSFVAKGRPGWLWKDTESNRYFVTPCKGELGKIEISEVQRLFPRYRKSGNIYDVNKSISVKGWYPEYDDSKIVCTGWIGRKNHELLFPFDEEDNPLRIMDEEMENFRNIYENTPGVYPDPKHPEAPCFIKDLEDGCDIPVFFYERNGRTMIGLSKNFRIPCNYDVRDEVEYAQPRTDALDLAATMFGYVNERDKSLRGRIHVGHAFADHVISDGALLSASGVLGAPRASYYPLYLQQNSGLYNTYNALVGIAGRKLYRIHEGTGVERLPQPPEQNSRVGTSFKALPAGQTFQTSISVHNLRPVEIGALLAALTLFDADGCYHNLGMGKSFGYGKVRLTTRLGKGFTHDAAYYLRAFERQMAIFAGGADAYARTIQTVLGILSEHAPAVVKMMSLNDYKDSKDLTSKPGYGKERFEFTRLTERRVTFCSYLTAEDRTEVERAAENQ